MKTILKVALFVALCCSGAFAQPGFPWIVGSGLQANAPAACIPNRDFYLTTDTLAVGTCRPGNTWVYTPQTYSSTPTDGYYFVEPMNCGLTLTTGTWAANANAGAGAAAIAGTVKAQTGNTVFQGTTSAAANTFDVTCDITPTSRLTAGKGVVITKVTYMLGWQTTAPTSTGTAALSTITYAAPGSTAQGTVASFGGSLTVTGWNHGTPPAVTTSGQCYTESLVLGTPFAVTTDLTRLTLQTTVAQTAAAATVLQVCGAIVYYSNPNSI